MFLLYFSSLAIPRALEKILISHLQTSSKGVLLYGPRQSGKTTLIKTILRNFSRPTLALNADQRGQWWELLTSRELSKLTLLIAEYDLVFIDEAQRIPEIGLIAKIILDEFPEKKLILTGSSSLDLSSKISEPLTGRVYTYTLFPIAQSELDMPYMQREEQVEERLVFGSYPEVFSLAGTKEKVNYLQNLTNGYLYKDLLELGDIRNSNKILDLLKLIAFQIGSQVSLTELAGSLDMSRGTVERYIDLLEKSYVLFRLHGLSRNLRKEVKKMDKIYFYDTGIRNAVIGNFQLLRNRNDSGALWENFLIVERMKKQHYAGTYSSHYFWRLTSGAKIDFIEEADGALTGCEIKWSQKTAKKPVSWNALYPNAGFLSVNRSTWQKFVL